MNVMLSLPEIPDVKADHFYITETHADGSSVSKCHDPVGLELFGDGMGPSTKEEQKLFVSVFAIKNQKRNSSHWQRPMPRAVGGSHDKEDGAHLFVSPCWKIRSEAHRDVGMAWTGCAVFYRKDLRLLYDGNVRGGGRVLDGETQLWLWCVRGRHEDRPSTS